MDADDGGVITTFGIVSFLRRQRVSTDVATNHSIASARTVQTQRSEDSRLMSLMAILLAWLAFGSFAVPMKWPSVIDAQIHPLIFQSYKTWWFFVSSHVVLFSVPYRITWWGILSGLSWVPAGVGAVVAVQHIGIAFGQALWQATIIVTCFVWGFGIFHDEKIYSWQGTAAGLVVLIFGVVGMSLAFNLKVLPSLGPETAISEGVGSDFVPTSIDLTSPRVDMETPSSAGGGGTLSQDLLCRGHMATQAARAPSPSGACCSHVSSHDTVDAASGPRLQISSESARTQHVDSHERFSSMAGPIEQTSRSLNSVTSLFISRLRLVGLNTRLPRTRPALSDVRFSLESVLAAESTSTQSVLLGIAAALFNGVWGGSNLVPSHYAPLHGIDFAISFGVGALFVNAFLLMVYAVAAKFWWRCPFPSIHFRVMALPGFVSGSLWSLGNLSSLYVVSHMGQGIGASLIQSSVLVSGLWGIIYYRELRGWPLLVWSLFGVITLSGVVTLVLQEEKRL